VTFADLDPAHAVDALADCRAPYLIGVRHHSAVMASAMPALLDAAAPDLVLLELPEELQPWLEWLGAEDLEAPVALAAGRRDGRGLVFYPYADFSPELAAVRWARQHGVPVQAFDLPVGLARDDDSRVRTRLAPSTETPLSEAVGRLVGADDAEDMWDRMIEARSLGSTPEAIRRAALAVGWMLRLEQSTWGEVPAIDLQREAWMRQCLQAARAAGSQAPAAVIGAFHAPALLQQAQTPGRAPKPAEVVTSLVPYAFELLDSRTGYPAGIRDPEWQQGVWQTNATPEGAQRTVGLAVLRVCRELRRIGHAAGLPDAREAIRLAEDLARLRNLPAPGRRELVEALQSALAQGEPLGRGRAVAAAMQHVLVGKRRGRLGAGTPRSGLGPHVEAVVAELRLPGPRDPIPLEIRLDPLRSPLDRRRHVAIQRLLTCRVPYAQSISTDPDRLTGRWTLWWSPATSAMLELRGHRGVTLAQAAEGSLRAAMADAEVGDGPTPRLRLDTVNAAAECGLADLVSQQLNDLEHALPHQASLPELVEALEVCDRIGRGHVPGFQPSDAQRDQLSTRVVPTLASAALRQLEGLTGSAKLDDALALLALVQRVARGEAGTAALGDGRLRWALERMERDGSPLMQGAGGAVRVLLGHADAEAFGEQMGSWVDGAGDQSAQTGLAGRITGALAMAGPLLEAAPAVTDRLIERVAALDDTAFLHRLPALREGFEVLSPAARQRFLQALAPSVGGSLDLRLDHPAELLARWAEADQRGRHAVESIAPDVLAWGEP
jgi:hypothetical protein